MRLLAPALLPLLAALLLLGGCGPEDRSYSIEEVRENENPTPSAEKPQPRQRKWTFTVPDHWKDGDGRAVTSSIPEERDGCGQKVAGIVR